MLLGPDTFASDHRDTFHHIAVDPVIGLMRAVAHREEAAVGLAPIVVAARAGAPVQVTPATRIPAAIGPVMVVLAIVAVTVGELGSVLFAVVVIEVLLGELVGGRLIDFRHVAGAELGELREGAGREFVSSVLVNIKFADRDAAALGSQGGVVVVVVSRFRRVKRCGDCGSDRNKHEGAECAKHGDLLLSGRLVWTSMFCSHQSHRKDFADRTKKTKKFLDGSGDRLGRGC
jgi:hypothetical protein